MVSLVQEVSEVTCLEVKYRFKLPHLHVLWPGLLIRNKVEINAVLQLLYQKVVKGDRYVCSILVFINSAALYTIREKFQAFLGILGGPAHRVHDAWYLARPPDGTNIMFLQPMTS